MKIFFLHHQEGRENPQNGVLEKIGCLDGVFAILSSHMIPFWNPQDQDNVLGPLSFAVDTIRMIKKVRNVL